MNVTRPECRVLALSWNACRSCVCIWHNVRERLPSLIGVKLEHILLRLITGYVKKVLRKDTWRRFRVLATMTFPIPCSCMLISRWRITCKNCGGAVGIMSCVSAPFIHAALFPLQTFQPNLMNLAYIWSSLSQLPSQDTNGLLNDAGQAVKCCQAVLIVWFQKVVPGHPGLAEHQWMALTIMCQSLQPGLKSATLPSESNDWCEPIVLYYKL